MVVAGVFGFAWSPAESLVVGADVFAKAIAVFWIMGIGFSLASTVAIVALLRGEPRKLPIAVIAVESLLFVLIIVGLALS